MIRTVNKSVKKYKVDGGGTEELVEEDGVMTALPSMDIRYPDGDVMLDQSFLYRITANGTKPNINGGAFVTTLRGNTVKWNQLIPEDKRSASKSYGEDATYYVNITTGLSVTITESHKYYMSAYVARNISGNDGFTIYLLKNNNTFGGTLTVANGSENGLKSAILNATSSFVCGVLRVSNYTYKRGFSAGDSFSISNYTFIDLTTMFGTDDQIAAALGITTDDITTDVGAEAFEAWLETNLGKRDYYPYDAGSLVPTQFEAIKTTGSDWESSAPLAITSITGKLNGTGESVIVFPDGMKRVGNVYDEIKVEDGVLKAIKRVGRVTNLAWYVNATYNTFQARIQDIAIGKRYIPLECARYLKCPYISQGRVGEKQIGIDTLNGISYYSVVVKDSSYSTKEEFSTAMYGEPIYYELATPQEYILDGYDPKIKKIFLGNNEIVKAYKGNNKVYGTD